MLKRRTDTPEAAAFWQFVDERAEYVRTHYPPHYPGLPPVCQCSDGAVPECEIHGWLCVEKQHDT